jgi:hypothetical protein
VAFCQNAFSTTVAGAAPDFDRLPDFRPPYQGGTSSLKSSNHTAQILTLHCGTTRQKSFATSHAVAAKQTILEILHCFPRSAVMTKIPRRKTWRKRATEMDLRDLRCGKPRETSLVQNTIKS